MEETRSSPNYTDYYEIIESIGAGAFGCVYKVKEKVTNNYRAAKVIDFDRISENILMESGIENLDENLNHCIEDYIKEYKIMELCSQNNVNSVECYEYFKNDDQFVMIMELCDKNLFQLLAEKIRISREGFNSKEIYEIMKQLNNAFKIMKENKVIHRNLTLKNILIKYDDKEHKNFTIKLSDFCFSKRLESLSDFDYIETLTCMAPEILEGKEYNYKCDFWSIGIILYR